MLPSSPTTSSSRPVYSAGRGKTPFFYFPKGKMLNQKADAHAWLLIIVVLVATIVLGAVIYAVSTAEYPPKLIVNTDVSPADSGVLLCDEDDECFYLEWEDAPPEFREFIEEL